MPTTYPQGSIAAMVWLRSPYGRPTAFHSTVAGGKRQVLGPIDRASKRLSQHTSVASTAVCKGY